jgi:hypothetical protein
MPQKIYFRNAQGQLTAWTRCSVRNLPIAVPSDQREAFLEKMIADKPDLLGVGDANDTSDIEGPFCAFSQLKLKALNGRMIYPDLVMLWQSGHVVVVEVKLSDNPELRDRQVVAQLLEYAACLAQHSEQSLFEFFNAQASGATSWAGFIEKCFPKSNDPERLAGRLLDKFRSSKLHLIIACDEAPVGLRELVRGVVGQSALGEYEFRVVEIAPFVSTEGQEGVVFLPYTSLETEIVARSAVTVSIGPGQPALRVNVDVTPLDEVTDRIQSSRRRKNWTEQLFFDEVNGAVERGTVTAATANALRLVHDSLPQENIDWGTGEKVGSLWVVDRRISENALFTFSSNGRMSVSFPTLSQTVGAGLRAKLCALPGVILANTDYPSLKPEMWTPNNGPIIQVLKDLLASLS